MRLVRRGTNQPVIKKIKIENSNSDITSKLNGTIDNISCKMTFDNVADIIIANIR